MDGMHARLARRQSIRKPSHHGYRASSMRVQQRPVRPIFDYRTAPWLPPFSPVSTSSAFASERKPVLGPPSLYLDGSRLSIHGEGPRPVLYLDHPLTSHGQPHLGRGLLDFLIARLLSLASSGSTSQIVRPCYFFRACTSALQLRGITRSGLFWVSARNIPPSRPSCWLPALPFESNPRLLNRTQVRNLPFAHRPIPG